MIIKREPFTLPFWFAFPLKKGIKKKPTNQFENCEKAPARGNHDAQLNLLSLFCSSVRYGKITDKYCFIF